MFDIIDQMLGVSPPSAAEQAAARERFAAAEQADRARREEAEQARRAARPYPGHDVMQLAGRCRNGAQRDGGRLWHLVPDGTSYALCGITYGRRSAGWSESYGETVTCPRCARKAAALSTSTPSRAGVATRA